MKNNSNNIHLQPTTDVGTHNLAMINAVMHCQDGMSEEQGNLKYWFDYYGVEQEDFDRYIEHLQKKSVDDPSMVPSLVNLIEDGFEALRK